MSLYRAAVFGIKGFSEYTRSGFESASKRFNPADINVDLSDQYIMITGANSGIGKVTALECAKRHAHVYMVCRDEKRGKEAQEEIIQESNNPNIELYLCDMSKPEDVVAFTKKFIQLQKPLNVLCNNAGCMINERQIVNNEHEINFATNTLATYILTKNFIPILTKNQLPRVYITSSGGMYNVKLDPDDFNSTQMRPFNGDLVYSQNKRQQVVMAERLAERHPSIYFATWHPGWTDTPAVRSAMPSFYAKMQNRLRTPEQGADTLVWLCCQKDIAKRYKNGDFFQDRNVVSKHLPLAWTKSTVEEDERFMKNLDQIYEKYAG
jgi:dehydrogenase/reductase SDR family protein 12